MDKQVFLSNFLGKLMTRWQAKSGKTLGIDQHLQIRSILQAIDPDRQVSEIKSILSPILTDSAEEQEDFYILFDQLLAEVRISERELRRVSSVLLNQTNPNRPAYWQKKAEEEWAQLPENKKQWGSWLLFALILITGLSILYYQASQPAQIEVDETNKEIYIPVNIEQTTFQTLCLNYQSDSRGIPDKIVLSDRKVEKVTLTSEINGPEICLSYRGKKPGREIINYQLEFPDGSTDQLFIIFRVESASAFVNQRWHINNEEWQAEIKSPSDITSFQLDSSIATSNNDLLQAMSDTSLLQPAVEYQPESSKFRASSQAKWQLSTRGISWPLWKTWILLGVLAGLFLLFWWINRQRIASKLSLQRPTNQAYDWLLRFPVPAAIHHSHLFYRVLSDFRQRMDSQRQQLDIKATLKTTIENAGRVSISYAQEQESRQFLFLILSTQKHDHQSQALALMIRQWQEMEAPLVYLLSTDGQNWLDQAGKNYNWDKVKRQYGTHHLIVASSPDLWEKSGAPYLKNYTAWKSRVLLWSKPASKWHSAEEKLSDTFRLVPNESWSWLRLAEALEVIEPLNFAKLAQNTSSEIKEWPNSSVHSSQWLPHLKKQLIIKNQRGEQDDRLLQWLAGIMLPPVPVWQWTMWVGKKLESPNHPLLSWENLNILASFPPLQNGEIPDQLRYQLLKWLAQNYTDTHARLRRRWREVLETEQNIPPVGSLHWNAHRIQMILNELFLSPEKKQKKQLEQELEALLTHQTIDDALILSYLDQREGIVASPPIRFLRRIIQKRPVIFWHFRDWTKIAAFLLPLCFLLALLRQSESVIKFEFPSGIEAVTFAPDGQSVLIACQDGSLAWCTTAGKWIRGVKASQTKLVNATFSNDGTTVYAAGRDGQVFAWDYGGIPRYYFNINSTNVYTDAIFPDQQEQSVIISTYSGKLEEWSLEDAQLLVRNEKHKDAILTMSLSTDAQQILTAGREGKAYLWQLPITADARPQVFDKEETAINATAISPNGAFIALGMKDNTVILLNKNGQQLHLLEGHDYDVMTLAFSPDSKYLLSGSGDKKAVLWDVSSGKRLTRLAGHRDYVGVVQFSPNGEYILTADKAGVVRIWPFGR